MTQKCPICTKAKGKRGCLINNHSLICSKCCAEIRNSECETCSYYKESQKHTIEKANKATRTFTMRIDDEVDAKITDALEMIDSGNISAGEQMLQSLAKDNDDLFSMHFAMGVLHIKKEQFEEALKSFDKSVQIFPYFVDAWFNKALAAQNLLDVVAMVESLRKVVEINELDNPVTQQAKEILDITSQNCMSDLGIDLDAFLESMRLFNHGFELMQKKSWHEALLELERSSNLNLHNAPTFGNMAICYMQLNENDKAMEYFDRSIEIDPNYEPALINREILINRIDNNVSNNDLVMKEVFYGKDYSVEDKKSLINDYLNDAYISMKSSKKVNIQTPYVKNHKAA